METERKDRSFLGRLRDYFTLTGLAKHLKENRDFARVGEEDRNGVEGMKSLQLREKWQQGPNKPNSSTTHDGTCCTTQMTLWWLCSCQIFINFYSSQFFHPVLHHLPEHPAPPPSSFISVFAPCPSLAPVRPPRLHLRSQKAGVWLRGINPECSLVMTHPQMARRSTRFLPRSAPVTNKEASEAVKINSQMRWFGCSDAGCYHGNTDS